MMKPTPLDVVRSVAERSDIEIADVLQVYPEDRSVVIRYRSSSHIERINADYFDPYSLTDDKSGLLVYTGKRISVPIGIVHKRPIYPSATLGDVMGGTKFSIYNAQLTEVAYINSLGYMYSGHLYPRTGGTYDLGSADLKWNNIYADYIAGTLTGQEWQYSGNMTIDANDSGDTTLYILNDGGGQASLNVEKDIIVGGLVDGVDVADHSARHDIGSTDALTTVAPAFTLSTSNAIGSGGNFIRSTATIALFDTTNPVTIDAGNIADDGSVGYAARRDHVHGVNAVSDGDTTKGELLKTDASGLLRVSGFGVGIAAVSGKVVLGSSVGLSWSDVELQRGAANQLNLATGDDFRSSGYISGESGWKIDSDGTAEFQNVYVRGELWAAVFVKGLIEAHAGTLVVAKSAGALSDNMVVPDSGTWYMYLNDPPGGAAFLFDNGDICECKGEVSGGVLDCWFTVASRYNMGDGRQRYTCTWLGPGTQTARTFGAGTPVLDYGVSGDGLVSIDGASDLYGAGPNISVATHAGWADGLLTTLRARIGNLNGSYGISSDRYGVGIGDYSAGNYLLYDPTDGFKIAAAGGVFRVDGDGAHITVTTTYYDGRAYRFRDGSTEVGGLYSYAASSIDHVSIRGKSVASRNTYVFSQADSPSGQMSMCGLDVANGGVSQGGLVIIKDTDDSCYIEISHDTYILGNDSLRVGGGLWVGSTATDPDLGSITAYYTASANAMVRAYYNGSSAYHSLVQSRVGASGTGNAILQAYNGGPSGIAYVNAYSAGYVAYLQAQGYGSSTQYSYLSLDSEEGDSDVFWRFSHQKGDYENELFIYKFDLIDSSTRYWVRVAPHSTELNRTESWFAGRVNIGYITYAHSTNLSLGLTINQGAYDDEAIALLSSDVGHGGYGSVDAACYGRMLKSEAAAGGLDIQGFKDSGGVAGAAAMFSGFLDEAPDTTTDRPGRGVVEIRGFQTSSGALQNISDDANVLVIRTYSGNTLLTRHIFKGDGDIYVDGAVQSPYDAENDSLMARSLAQGLAGQWSDSLYYNYDRLHALGVVSGGRERPFVSIKRLNMLLMGAVGQLYERMERMETALLAAGIDPHRLPA